MHIRLLSIAFVVVTSVPAVAQTDAAWNLVDSPVKKDPEPYRAGGVIQCSLPLPADAFVFGVDHGALTGVACVTELFSPFRVFTMDENCAFTGSSWSTSASPASTLTGVAYPNGTAGTTYVMVDATNEQVIEYTFDSGIPTGLIFPLPSGGFWGPAVFNDHEPGEILYVEDVVNDRIHGFDWNAAMAPVCAFDNPDAPNAFGNGLTDAARPSDFGGATLVFSSGRMAEARVMRATQGDCSQPVGVSSTGCSGYGSWDLSSVLPPTTFINGICEFEQTSNVAGLWVVDNTTSTAFLLSRSPALKCTQPQFDKLRGWWTLDEAMGTTSADNHACSDGTHMGLPAIVSAKVGNGLAMSGSDSVVIPHDPCLDIGASLLAKDSVSFTIEAWVKTSNTTGKQGILKKLGGGAARGFAFYLDKGVPTLTLKTEVKIGMSTVGKKIAYSAATNVADGDWHHVAISAKRFAPRLGIFYVDGVPDGAVFMPLQGGMDNTQDAEIGINLDGEIDEVTFYDADLSPCEIEAIFDADAEGKCK